MSKKKTTTEETTTTTPVQALPEPHKETTPAEPTKESLQEATPAKSEITKGDAVRQAMDAGISKAKDIVQWVKERHNLDVSAGTVAQVKAKNTSKDSKDTTPQSNGVPTIDDLKMVKKLMDGQPFNSFLAQVQAVGKIAKEVGSFDKLEKCLNEMQELGMTA